MTKFEEDLNKKMDLKEVPMYFTQSGCSITRKTYIETNWIFDNYKNWHSDEEFQELLDKYINLNDNYEKEVIRSSKIESQIIDLKSQLQQQALTVVPDFVAEWYEKKKNKLELAVYKINTLIDKKSFNDLTKIEKWFEGVENKPIETIFKMKDGYTVEKPQLLYLREKNTGYYLNKSKNNGLELVPNPYFDEDNQFTKQEIDSMETGSYEQIEVVE